MSSAAADVKVHGGDHSASALAVQFINKLWRHIHVSFYFHAADLVMGLIILGLLFYVVNKLHRLTSQSDCSVYY